MAFAEQRAERASLERARKARADQEFQRRQTERLEAERARKLYDKQARELIALRREMKERSEPGYGPKRWCWPGALQTSGLEHSPFLHAKPSCKPDPHVSCSAERAVAGQHPRGWTSGGDIALHRGRMPGAAWPLAASGPWAALALPLSSPSRSAFSSPTSSTMGSPESPY